MGLSEGREAEHSGTGPSLPVADFIIDTPHGAGGGMGGWAGDPIKAGSLSSLHKISSFVLIAWDYKHEYPNFNFCLSRKESLNENLLPCCCNRVDSQGCRRNLSICILLKIDEWRK